MRVTSGPLAVVERGSWSAPLVKGSPQSSPAPGILLAGPVGGRWSYQGGERLHLDPGHLLPGWLASRRCHRVCQGLWTARGHEPGGVYRGNTSKGVWVWEPLPSEARKTAFSAPPHP